LTLRVLIFLDIFLSFSSVYKQKHIYLKELSVGIQDNWVYSTTFIQSKQMIQIKEDHDFIRLTKLIPLSEQISIAMMIRASKVNDLVGSEPHRRELLGAVALMSIRQITYQQAEDLIPYPHEVGFLKRFKDLVSNGLQKVGGKLSKIKTQVKENAQKAKYLVRNSHLFAKTKEEKC
jgi:hypothetical protein